MKMMPNILLSPDTTKITQASSLRLATSLILAARQNEFLAGDKLPGVVSLHNCLAYLFFGGYMSPTSAQQAPRRNLKFFLTLSLIFCAIGSVQTFGQDATSTAAAARTRYLAELGVLPASREVAVEEFVNYHRHQIGRPKSGEAVALDVRWGNNESAFGREAVLQIGFSTALANDRRELRPINLSLVIDKSGSMEAADKLSRVKTALLNLVSQMRERDTLSIVVFDTEAEVLMPARTLRDKEAVKRLIRSIEPGSSTNIHAGLMLGYHEVLKNYREGSTNRVILLTDGIANQGVTDPDRIAQDSLRFNDRGIDLSTIGVGLELNKDLLRHLAKSGRGLFHFVADSEDIEKVFVKEVQSLVSPVASEPDLEIEYDDGLELVQLYGYEPLSRPGYLRIKLDNMNHGMTQVVMLRFRLTRRRPLDGSHLVKERFTYRDLEQRKDVFKKEDTFLNVRDYSMGDMLKDSEVAKNYSIALLAQAIREMAAACEAQRFREAENVLARAIDWTIKRYPNLEDEDITRTLSIAEKYQTALRKYNRERDPKPDM
jgi:Mg-chelatase subunit ChlD